MENKNSSFSNFEIELESLPDKSNLSRKNRMRNTINCMLIFFSVLNILNFIIPLIVTGFNEIINFSRLIASLLEIILVFINNKIFKINKVSKKLKIILIILIIIFTSFCICFIIISILIFTGYKLKIDDNVEIDYLIVLGTKIKNNEPGLLLKKRLQKTTEFYTSHKNITLILSGGKTSSNSDLSEAEVMKKYLMSKIDISEEQIIIEDSSKNTIENFKNILKIVGNDKNFGLCTSNSHMYRAFGLAKKLNYINLNPLSAKGSVWTFYRDVISEFYCIIIQYISGKMKFHKF